MANKIIPKRSSVVAKVPLAGDLEVGEIAVNLADALIFTKNAAGVVITLGGSSGGSSLPTQTGNSGGFLTTNGTTASWGSISSANVTTALGFTPYNATNPAGYITASSTLTGSVNTTGTVTATGGLIGRHGHNAAESCGPSIIALKHPLMNVSAENAAAPFVGPNFV